MQRAGPNTPRSEDSGTRQAPRRLSPDVRVQIWQPEPRRERAQALRLGPEPFGASRITMPSYSPNARLQRGVKKTSRPANASRRSREIRWRRFWV